MSQVRVLEPDWRPRLTLKEVLDLLHPDRFDEVESSVRQMRESYRCPAMVPSYTGFKRELLKFYSHYFVWAFGVPFQRADQNEDLAISEAFDFAEAHLKNYPGGMMAAERNAITGRSGALIAVVDSIAEGLAKARVEAYINAVFRNLMAPSDFDTRCWIVEQLLLRVAPALFPQEQLKRPEYWAGHMEEFVKAYVMHIHGLRRDWRV